MIRALIRSSAVSFVLFFLPVASAETSITQLMGDRLRAGELAPLQTELEALVAKTPNDDQTRFALGATQFLMAIERLGQSMYRYGLEPPREVQRFMPLFRFPVPRNPKPEHLTYELMHGVLQQFVTDLAVSEATLAKTGTSEVKLPIAIGLARLDLNGDGKATPDETLWQVFNTTLGGGQLSAADAERFIIAFDRGDVAWLRGYAHLLSAIGEFLLAHDWHEGFDDTFHMVFPNAGLPASVLHQNTATLVTGFDDGEIADFIAFIHLMHWPVKEPERMKAVLTHLESVVAMSRESWKYILAETDNEAEWIPNPKQTNTAMPNTALTQQQVDTWMVFLDEFEALLQGKKLLPHWRLAKGINLKRVFTEPTTFDPILWAQGAAALPYLEDGPLTTGATWNRMMAIFEGNFLGYVVWFN